LDPDIEKTKRSQNANGVYWRLHSTPYLPFNRVLGWNLDLLLRLGLKSSHIPLLVDLQKNP
jgi:hypothetical protein